MTTTKPARSTRTSESTARRKAAAKRAKAPAARPDAKPAADRSKARPRARTGLSGLDAAATVLAESGMPMSCTQIMDRIRELKLWTTKGKTPAATLSAAIGREIKTKGKDARFRKEGRGTFTVNGT